MAQSFSLITTLCYFVNGCATVNNVANKCINLYQTGGGGGTLDATQDLNPLLLTNNCVYSVLQI